MSSSATVLIFTVFAASEPKREVARTTSIFVSGSVAFATNPGTPSTS